MAINVQIKGDRKYEDTVATNEYRNGTYVNNAYTQPWIAGLDAFNPNQMYTTPMLDGMSAKAFYANQVPSSFASLYGNRAFQTANPFVTWLCKWTVSPQRLVRSKMTTIPFGC